MAGNEQTTEVTVRESDYDRKPVVITQAEIDRMFAQVFGRLPSEEGNW